MPTFTLDYTAPAAPEGFDLAPEEETSSITASWTATSLVDFLEYVLERRYSGGEWEVIASIRDQETVEYVDYEAPLNTVVEYRLRVGTTELESAPVSANATLESDHWWLVTPGDTELTFALLYVIDFDESTPLDDEEMVALSRSRAIVQRGELLGSSGQLRVHLTPENSGLLALVRRASVVSDQWVILKSALGDLYRSRLRTISRTRLQAGHQVITVPYTEVA